MNTSISSNPGPSGSSSNRNESRNKAASESSQTDPQKMAQDASELEAYIKSPFNAQQSPGWGRNSNTDKNALWGASFSQMMSSSLDANKDSYTVSERRQRDDSDPKDKKSDDKGPAVVNQQILNPQVNAVNVANAPQTITRLASEVLEKFNLMKGELTGTFKSNVLPETEFKLFREGSTLSLTFLTQSSDSQDLIRQNAAQLAQALQKVIDPEKVKEINITIQNLITKEEYIFNQEQGGNRQNGQGDEEPEAFNPLGPA